MESRAITKINTLGKWAYIISKIGKIALIIAAVVLAAGLMIMTYIPADLFHADVGSTFDVTVNKSAIGGDIGSAFIMGSDMNASFNIGSTEYGFVDMEDFADAIVTHFRAESQLSLSNLRIMLWAAFACVLLTLALMWFASDTCKTLRDCDSPFEEPVLKSLTKLMYALIPWVVLFDTAKSVMESALSGKLNIVVGIDLGRLLVVLLMVLLINVFRHGAELQQQADETL